MKIVTLKRYIEAAAFRLFGIWGLGFVSGLLWSTRKYLSKDKLTILAVSNTLFDKDLAEIDREGDFNWIFLAKNGFGKSQQRFLPKALQKQREYYPSMIAPQYSKNWSDLEEFGVGLLSAFRMFGRVDAAISAHIDYWQDEGLRRACARRGIPFLVLCQENYNIPHTYRVRKEEFAKLGFRFGGTAIATFSDHMREMFLDLGVASPDQVVVTGAPRLDGWRHVANSPGQRIVLLSFFDPGKYLIEGDEFFRVVEALREAVRRNPGWELVIKCKNAANEAGVRERVGGAAGLTIVHDTPLPELLSAATVIVGAGSLSMVESLLSEAALIVPAFASRSNDPDTMLFNPNDRAVSECISFAKDAGELNELVAAAMQRKLEQSDRSARIALMQRYIHFDDRESSSRRVSNFIRKYADDVPSHASQRVEETGIKQVQRG